MFSRYRFPCLTRPTYRARPTERATGRDWRPTAHGDIPRTADRPGDRLSTATGRARRRSPGRVRRQGDDDDLLRTHVTSGGELARTDEKTKITTLR